MSISDVVIGCIALVQYFHAVDRKLESALCMVAS